MVEYFFKTMEIAVIAQINSGIKKVIPQITKKVSERNWPLVLSMPIENE